MTSLVASMLSVMFSGISASTELVFSVLTQAL